LQNSIFYTLIVIHELLVQLIGWFSGQLLCISALMLLLGHNITSCSLMLFNYDNFNA